MALTNAFLTTDPSLIYASTGTNAIVSAYFCNLGSQTVQFTLYAVPAGGTPEDSNTIYKTINVTTYDTFVMDVEKIILEDGEALWASASEDTALAVTIVTVGV